nr:DNA repair protein RAD50 [Tanacetum cinerariifolium]
MMNAGRLIHGTYTILKKYSSTVAKIFTGFASAASICNGPPEDLPINIVYVSRQLLCRIFHTDGAESVFVRSEGAVSRNINFDSIARFCSGTKLPSGFRYTSGYQVAHRVFNVEWMGPENASMPVDGS